MKALINPAIVEQGYYQVVQLSNTEFEVAAPLFWTDSEADIIAYVDWYDPKSNTFKKLPPIEPTAEQNKKQAILLLSNTDWINEPDVYNPSNIPHLTNRDEFLSYRLTVRRIAVDPVAGNLNWPSRPIEQWSK